MPCLAQLLGRLRKEDRKFEASPGKPCLKIIILIIIIIKVKQRESKERGRKGREGKGIEKKGTEKPKTTLGVSHSKNLLQGIV